MTSMTERAISWSCMTSQHSDCRETSVSCGCWHHLADEEGEYDLCQHVYNDIGVRCGVYRTFHPRAGEGLNHDFTEGGERVVKESAPDVIRCESCGLACYQTSAPHVCVEWARGRAKTNHQRNASGNCSVSGCPCKGAPTTEHEPVARGGEGERIKVELVNGVEGQCVSVNDYRICGPKPWGGGSIVRSWNADKNDVLRAFLTPDQKHAWLADDLQVVSVNQHHSLLAERDRLRSALEVIRDSFWSEGEPYQERVEHLQQLAKDALNEQERR